MSHHRQQQQQQQHQQQQHQQQQQQQQYPISLDHQSFHGNPSMTQAQSPINQLCADGFTPTQESQLLAAALRSTSENTIVFILELFLKGETPTVENYRNLVTHLNNSEAGSISPQSLHLSSPGLARPAWVDGYVQERANTTSPGSVLSRRAPFLEPARVNSVTPALPNQERHLPGATHPLLPTARASSEVPPGFYPVTPLSQRVGLMHFNVHRAGAKDPDVPTVDRDDEQDDLDDDEDGGTPRALSPVNEIQARPPNYKGAAKKKDSPQKKPSKNSNPQPIRVLKTTAAQQEKAYEFITASMSMSSSTSGASGFMNPTLVANQIMNFCVNHSAMPYMEPLEPGTVVNDVVSDDGDVAELSLKMLKHAKESVNVFSLAKWQVILDWCICASFVRRMTALGTSMYNITYFEKMVPDYRRIHNGWLRWMKCALALGDLAFTPFLINIGENFWNLIYLSKMSQPLFSLFLFMIQEGHDNRNENDVRTLWQTNPTVAIRRNAALFTAKYMIPIILGIVYEYHKLEGTHEGCTRCIVHDICTDDSAQVSSLTGVDQCDADMCILLAGSSGVQICTPSTALLAPGYKSLLKSNERPPPRTSLDFIMEKSALANRKQSVNDEEFQALFLAYRAVHSFTDDKAAEDFAALVRTSLEQGSPDPRWILKSPGHTRVQEFQYTPMDPTLQEEATREGMKAMGLDRDGNWTRRRRLATPYHRAANEDDGEHEGEVDETDEDKVTSGSSSDESSSDSSDTDDSSSGSSSDEEDDVAEDQQSTPSKGTKRYANANANPSYVYQQGVQQGPLRPGSAGRGEQLDDEMDLDLDAEGEDDIDLDVAPAHSDPANIQPSTPPEAGLFKLFNSQTTVGGFNVDSQSHAITSPHASLPQRARIALELCKQKERAPRWWAAASISCLFRVECGIRDWDQGGIYQSCLHQLFETCELDEIRAAINWYNLPRVEKFANPPSDSYQAGRWNAIAYVAHRYSEVMQDHGSSQEPHIDDYRKECWLFKDGKIIPADGPLVMRQPQAQLYIDEYEECEQMTNRAIYETAFVRGHDVPNSHLAMVHFLYMHVERLLQPFPGAYTYFRTHFSHNPAAYVEAIRNTQPRTVFKNVIPTIVPMSLLAEDSDATEEFEDSDPRGSARKRGHVRGILASDDVLTDDDE